MGNPRKGDLWETTAIPELRLQAAELARDLLRSLKERISLPTAYSIAFGPAAPIFRQLFDRESSTYTYLIADSGTGEAILIDPVLEQVDRDRQILWQLGLTLGYTMETHVHADHITGAHRLRELTNCSILVPENAEVSDIDGYVRDGDIWTVAGQQLKIGLQRSYQEYYAIKKAHIEERGTYLDNLAEALAQEGFLRVLGTGNPHSF